MLGVLSPSLPLLDAFILRLPIPLFPCSGRFCPANLIMDVFILSLVNPLIQAQGFLYSIPTVPPFFFLFFFSSFFCSQTVIISSWSLFCFWVAWHLTLQRYKKRHGISILPPRVIQNLTCVLAVSEKRFKSCHLAPESGHSFLIWSSVIL